MPLKMWKNLVGKIWRHIPGSIRLKLTRATQQKFTVSVVAVVVNEEEKILLLDHVLRPSSSWGLPGGFIEQNEPPEEAVKRELFEETGLTLEEIELLRVRVVNRHVEILFRARAGGLPELKSIEIKDAGWFSQNEMPAQISRVQRRIIEQALADKIS